MADRTVVVRLVAMVGQYQAAIAQSAATTRALDAQVAATNRASAAATKGMLASQQSALGGMASTMRSMRGMVLGLGVPLGLAMMGKSFFAFEQQMAHTKAVADSFGRSTVGFTALSDAALSMGQKFGFSAVEVGQAQEALVKAGRTTAQVLGGELSAALTLAAAGTISLDEAAKITATTMTVFKKETLSAATIADTLSGAANATVSSVGEMGSALSYVGPLAASLGVSFKDTVATISVFNQAGIEGERAGTNLRGMLTNLLSPSAMARKEMIRLGIDLFDASGKFVGMSNAAQILHDKVGKLGGREQAEAVGRLTTNASMPGFITLMHGGAAAVDQMKKAIADSATAEEVAAQKLDSVTGEFKKFGAAVETAGIKTIGTLEPALSGLAKSLTGAARGFGDMTGASQLALLALGAQLLLARRVSASMRTTSGSIGEVSRAYQMLARPGGNALPPGVIGPRLPGADQLRGTINQAGLLTRTFGSMNGAWRMQTGLASKFGAVGAQAMRGVAGAGRKLVDFLGGPLGLAMAAATIGFVIWQAKVAENKRVVDEFHSGLAQLGQAYRSQGAVSEDNVRAMFREGGQMQWLAGNARQLGLSMDTIGQAAAGQGPAIDEVTRQLASYEKSVGRVHDFIASHEINAITGILGGDLSKESLAQLEAIGVKAKSGDWFHTEKTATLDRLDAVARSAKTAREEFEKTHKSEVLLAKAMDDINAARLADQMSHLGVTTAESNVALDAMMTNLATMDSTEAAFSDRIGAMTENVGALATAFHSVADAQSAFFAAAQEGLAGAFREDVKESGGGGGAAPKYGTTTTSEESSRQSVVEGKAASRTVRVVKGGKAPKKPVPDKISTTQNADGTTTTVTTRTAADGTKTITTERTGVPASTEREKTRQQTTTTRRPDGTTLVTTTTTAADGSKTTETRKSHDPADARKAAEKTAPTTRAVAPKLDVVTGQLDVSTATGRKQHAAMTGMADASAKTVVDTFTQVATAGKNTGEAMEFAGVVATAAFAKQRTEAMKALIAVGMNKDVAKQLVDAYYALPAEVATRVNAEGAEEALADLDKLHLQLVTMPQGKVSILANTKAQAAELATLGGTIKKLPDGRFRVDFTDQTKTHAALDGALKKIQKVPEKVPVKVSVEKEQADKDLLALLARKDQVATGIDIWLNAHPERAASDIQNFKNWVEGQDDQILDVWIRTQKYDAGKLATKNVDKAKAEAAERAMLEQDPGRLIGPRSQGHWDPYNSTWVERPRRWGGVREAMNGSLREAELAGPGTRYQWAEKETGGEAFIPKYGRRARSEGILATAAGWYGLGLHKMAAGGASWSGQQLTKVGSSNVVISVRGEGVLSGMIEATVDGRLVKVAQTVAHGRTR